MRALGTAAAVAAAVSVLWLRFNVAPGHAGRDARGTAHFGDLLNFYFGTFEYTALRLAAGDLPLWNPHACSGVPLLATAQAAVFYPGTWLGVFLPMERALPVLLFAQCVLGGWFCALLFRSWNRSHFAAAAGGVLFVFACLLGETFWPPVVATLLWLPWLLLCIEKYVRTGSWRWWAGLAVGIALQTFAGFPQHQVHSFLLAIPFAGVRLLDARAELGSRQIRWRAGALAAGAGLGIALAAVQLLPTLELVENGPRRDALSAAEVHYLSLWRGHRALNLLRNAFDPRPKLILLDYGTGGGYLGAATLVALALGVFSEARRRLTWLLLGVGGTALLLSDGYLGWGRWLYELYAKLPVVGSLRAPERMRVLSGLCAIALAVAGFDRLARPLRDRRLRLRLTLVAAAAALAAGLGMAAVGALAGTWRVAATLVLVLALLGLGERRVARGAALALLGALLLVDLALATEVWGSLRALPAELARRIRPSGHPSVPDRWLMSARAEARLGRVEFVGFLPFVPAAPLAGWYRIACYEPLAPSPWPELTAKLGQSGKGRFMVRLDPHEFPLVYDVASVGRILAVRRGQVEDLRNADALPRAYLVEAFELASLEETLEQLKAGERDLSRLVLLERDPGIPSAGRPSELRPARIRRYAPERVEIEVATDRAGLLVLTDSYYPGWEAHLDGAPAEIHRANGLYRAVVVPPGSHQVVFEYRPRSFRAGASISLAALGVLAGSGALALRRRRRLQPF